MRNDERYRLVELQIEGFRGYPSLVKVEFPEQLVVIYGRNGRGKSTLFDAISWLFNKELPRFKAYGNEWTRAKKSHVRSLFAPDTPTRVISQFQEVISRETVNVERSEEGLSLLPDNKLKRWFSRETGHRNDRLWAHMLSQDELQVIAKAKGRERLEALAPKLDLVQSQIEINKITEQIRRIKDQLKVYKENLKALHEFNDTQVLNRIRETGKEIVEEFDVLRIDVAVSPPLLTNAREELQHWSRWVQTVNEFLSLYRSELSGDIKSFSYLYPNPNVTITTPVDRAEIFNTEHQLSKCEQQLKETEIRKNLLVGEIEELERTLHDAEVLREDLIRLQQELIEIEEENARLHARVNNSDSTEKLRYISQSVRQYNNEIAKLQEEENDLQKARSSILYSTDNLIELEQLYLQNNQAIREHKLWLGQHGEDYEDQQIDELERQLQRLAGHLSKDAATQESVRYARTVLRDNITDESCLLCGATYESQDMLFEAIERKKTQWEQQLQQITEEISKVTHELQQFRMTKKERFKRSQNMQELVQEQRNLDNTFSRHIELLYLPQIGWDLECEKFVKHREWRELGDYLLNQVGQLLKNCSEKHENILLKRLDDQQAFQMLQNKKEEAVFQIALCKQQSEHVTNKIMVRKKALNDIVDKYQISISNQSDVKLVIDSLRQRKQLVQRDFSSLTELQNEDKKELEAATLNLLKLRYWQKDRADELMKKMSSFAMTVFSLGESLKQLDEIATYEKRIKELTTEQRSLQKVLKVIRDGQSEEISQAIGELSNRISTIFEFLSMPSIWRTVRTDVEVPNEKERTNLLFRPIAREFQGVDGNATFLFSSGQFSVLGLSIFLANAIDMENQKINGGAILDTLFIDDPINALDVLRDDALALLLCDIAREKQVVVSTSDINFANRLMLASRPIWEAQPGSCGVIYVDSTSDNGSQVEVRSPVQWITDQGIYLPERRERNNNRKDREYA